MTHIAESRWKRITGRMNGRDFSMVVDPSETDVEHLRTQLMNEGGAENVQVDDLVSAAAAAAR